MTRSSIVQASPHRDENSTWITAYCEACLYGKNPRTIDVYQRVPRDFFLWLTQQSRHTPFPFDQFTRTLVERYMTSLVEASYSISHRTRIKSVLSSFCQWLIDEHGLFKRHPTRGLEIPAQQVLAPRVLSEEQRSILRTLVGQANDSSLE